MKKTAFLYVWVIFQMPLVGISVAAVQPPKNPNSAKECAICHYRWIDTFYIEGRGTELAAYHSEKVVATPEMCFSCHDGSVLDSREKMAAGYRHKTDMPPPAHMKVPDIFPLDDQGKVQCSTCHTAHAVPSGPDSKDTIFLRLSNQNSDMCRGCHSEMGGGIDAGHHPAGRVQKQIPRTLIAMGAVAGENNNRIICQTCHKAHGAKGVKLTIFANKGSRLCVTCHDAQTSLFATKHDLRSSFSDETNIKQQRPSESGPCGVCHMPHNSANKRLWAKTLPEGKDSKALFCLSCHSKGKLAEKVTISGTSHPLNVSPFEKIQALTASEKPLALPLFNRYGTPDNKGNITCSTCHDPHGSKADAAPAASKEAPKKGTAEFFLRHRQQDLCEACHQDKTLITGTKHDLARVAPESKNISNKTPSESGLCGSCHLVHNGQGAFLWARGLPTQGGNVTQKICTSCHCEQGMAGKKVIKDYSHPVDVSPGAKGMATILPLFDKTGKRSKDGVMTCLTCHDPHRWAPSESVSVAGTDIEGTAQNSFLRLQSAPAPRLCSSCHKDEGTLEKTDHDLRLSAPHSKNIMDQTPAESGACGVCHQVHNSRNWTRLWAQGFATGNSLMEMMCNYCHSRNGPAKKKIPQISSHPAQAMTISGKNDKKSVDYFPLFQKNFGEPVRSANISCPSCHNVHRWGAGNHAKGSGVKFEGDATNSFLRGRSSIRPCKDCHGADALYRYKYFHKADARGKKPSQFSQRKPY
jgi:predicted CXXCH cytochrome family protein